MIRRLIAVVVGVLAVLAAGTPAFAHSGSAPAGSEFRSRMDPVTPRVRGLHLRLVEHGSHLELRNGTGREVVVRGYSSEPYLRFTRDAVFANVHSPTAYVNKTLAGSQARNAAQAPSWRRVGAEPVLRWHDHRTHWVPKELPPVAAADPLRTHRISDWEVELTVGGRPVRATGTLDYLPPPPTSVWWVGMVLAAGAVAVVGRWRRALGVLAGVLSVAAVAELADGVGHVLDKGAAGLGGVLAGLITEETLGTFTALGALAAVGLALRAQPAAAFALALTSACLGVLGGLTDVGVFAHGAAPVPWSSDVARACTAATLGLSTGVVVAAWQRLRADRPSD